MDTKQIRRFLKTLEKTRRRLTGEELDLLYRLAFHPDALVRSDVAALLVDHYEEKSEEILLRLTHDSEPIVRTDAADSLCIGRRERTLERLIHLAEHDPEYTVRGFAVHSTYDVFINLFGDSDNTHKVVRTVLYPLLEQEEDDWVRTCYYCVLCLAGDKASLEPLLAYLDDESYYIRTSVVEAFEDILSEENEAAIEEALQYHLPFEEDEMLNAKIEDLLLRIEESRQDLLF